MPGYRQVQLIGRTFRPVSLLYNGKPKHFRVKILAAGVVIRQDRNMVNGLYIHDPVLSTFAALPILPRCVSGKPLKYFKPYPIARSIHECPSRISPADWISLS